MCHVCMLLSLRVLYMYCRAPCRALSMNLEPSTTESNYLHTLLRTMCLCGGLICACVYLVNKVMFKKKKMQERLGNKAGIIIQKLVYVGQDAYMLDKERLHLRCFCLPYAWIRPPTSKMYRRIIHMQWYRYYLVEISRNLPSRTLSCVVFGACS